MRSYWTTSVIFGAILLNSGCGSGEELQRLKLVLPDLVQLPGERDRPANRAERRKNKRRRFKPAAVYVDGKFTGMMRYKELPPQLPTIYQELEDGRLVRRFGWVDYVESVGVKLDVVRALHISGGRDRTCVIEGDELRRVGNLLRFSFSRSDSGKARMEYPEDGVETNASVDMIRSVTIYRDKEPPHLEGRAKLLMPDGTPVKGIPYAEGERHGGTRVYVDGVYVGAFRRREMTNDLLMNAKDKASPYALDKALSKLGVNRVGIKRIQLVARNETLVADLDGADLAKKLGEIGFILPEHSNGRIVVPSLSKDDKLAAIILYRASQPAARTVPAKGAKGNGSGSNQAAP
jgi:hypothetical protein